MIWPFKRRRRPPDKLTQYGEALIAQGLDRLQVERAVALVRRMIVQGGLQEYRYLLDPVDAPDPVGARPLDLITVQPQPPAPRRDDADE